MATSVSEGKTEGGMDRGGEVGTKHRKAGREGGSEELDASETCDRLHVHARTKGST